MIQSYEELVARVHNKSDLEQETHLVLFSHQFDTSIWALLTTNYLTRLYNLLYLDLAGCGLDDRRVEEILGVLKTNNIFVEELHLGGNYISDYGADSIANYLKCNKRLVALNLRYNNIGNQGLAQLAKSLSIHEAIEILDLSVNYFDDTGVQALCYSLMMNHTLIELNLSGNGLKDCMFAIAECVLHHQQLEDLDLSNNKFGTEIELFCTAMSKICLLSLNLSHNEIQDPECVNFLGTLGTNTSLIRLNLSQNNIGDDSGFALAKAFGTNKSLAILILADNQLSVRSCRSLINAIHDHPTLHHLNMMRNALSVEDCIQLRDVVSWQSKSPGSTHHIVYSTFDATNTENDEKMFRIPSPEHFVFDEGIQDILDVAYKFREEVNQVVQRKLPTKKQDVNSSLTSTVEQRIDAIVKKKETKPYALQELSYYETQDPIELGLLEVSSIEPVPDPDYNDSAFFTETPGTPFDDAKSEDEIFVQIPDVQHMTPIEKYDDNRVFETPTEYQDTQPSPPDSPVKSTMSELEKEETVDQREKIPLVVEHLEEDINDIVQKYYSNTAKLSIIGRKTSKRIEDGNEETKSRRGLLRTLKNKSIHSRTSSQQSTTSDTITAVSNQPSVVEQDVQTETKSYEKSQTLSITVPKSPLDESFTSDTETATPKSLGSRSSSRRLLISTDSPTTKQALSDYVKKGKIKLKSRMTYPSVPLTPSNRSKGLKIWMEIDNEGMITFTTRSRFSKSKPIAIMLNLQDPELEIEKADTDDKTIIFRNSSTKEEIARVTSKRRTSVLYSIDFVRKLVVV